MALPQSWEACSLPGLVDMRVHHESAGQDRIVVDDLGPVRVVETYNGAGAAVRTAADVGSDDPDRYALFVQATGTSTGEHHGRTARFAPGDLGLVDLSQPMQCAFSARRTVLVTYPKQLSPLPASELSAVLGRRIRATGTAGLVSSMVRQLPGQLAADDGAMGARLGTAVLDLINVGLAAQLDRPSAASVDARQQALVLECRRFIEAHLADAALSPATVAAAHHLSVRQLHRLFEPTGDSVADLIRRRRLDRCRRDLLDPDQAERPVAAVGARWGLADGAHFSRAFKRAYGLAPGEFRATFSAASPPGQPRAPRH
jgi:AraC-like DNA-binding protein